MSLPARVLTVSAAPSAVAHAGSVIADLGTHAGSDAVDIDAGTCAVTYADCAAATETAR